MITKSGCYEWNLFPDFSGREYYNFTPTMLCSDYDVFEIDYDYELIKLLSQAHKLLGTLNGVLMYAPNIDSCLEMILKKEAQASCLIDGIKASYNDLIKQSCSGNVNSLCGLNYSQALHDYFAHEITNDTLNEIYGAVKGYNALGGICQYRKIQTFLHHYVTVNIEEYNPPAPENVLPLMDDLQQFIQANSNMDILVKAAIAHYQFEAIHPFENSNVLVGRILAIMILTNSKIVSRPIVQISHYFALDKGNYFASINTMQYLSDYTQWVKFFLKSLIMGTEHSVAQIRAAVELRSQNIDLIRTFVKSTKNVLAVFDYFEKYPIMSVREVSNALGLAFNTSDKAVQILVDLKILKQTVEQTRYRVFAYDDFVRIFDDA